MRRPGGSQSVLDPNRAIYVISESCKPKKKFMQFAIGEAKRVRESGDYPIGAVISGIRGRAQSHHC